MSTEVICDVNNCQHWAEGNKCAAEVITVTTHAMKETKKSEETDCQTFEPGVTH